MITFHINHGMLLRGLYKRIVLLFRLTHGILQVTFLKSKQLNYNIRYFIWSICPHQIHTHVMIFLVRVREMSIYRRRPDGSDSQLALLGHGFARVRYSTDQITMRRVRDPRCMRSVRRVSGSKISIVNRHHDRAILLGHRRDSIRVVRVGQMFLSIQESRQYQWLPVTTWWSDETTTTIPDSELMATTAAPAKIER